MHQPFIPFVLLFYIFGLIRREQGQRRLSFCVAALRWNRWSVSDFASSGQSGFIGLCYVIVWSYYSKPLDFTSFVKNTTKIFQGALQFAKVNVPRCHVLWKRFLHASNLFFFFARRFNIILYFYLIHFTTKLPCDIVLQSFLRILYCSYRTELFCAKSVRICKT